MTGLTTFETAAEPKRSRPLQAHRLLESGEAGIAIAAFLALCVAVLLRSTRLLEPDDLAYRASIVALTQGHLSLTNEQYLALAQRLGGIAQWTHLPNGSWMSEKNPGYPFFAAPFQLLGLLRLAPLFYGALGCIGLFFGGRRWLGRYGGTLAVVLYCSSGATLVFAWRATMPTFTDASLVAAGTGALLWAMLAREATSRRRTVVGLLAFLALEGAVSIRYTNLVVLLVAVVAVTMGRRAARLPIRTLAAWLGSTALLAASLAVFDAHYYGGITKTGYSSGEITFSLSAFLPNLEHMPSHLVRSMPLLLFALAATGWIAVRMVRGFVNREPDRITRNRDGAVGAALAACWLGIYGLYAAYTWTVSLSPSPDSTLQVVRFYLPALGAVALLAAWLLTRLPRPLLVAALVTLVCLAAVTYPELTTSGPGGPGGAGNPPGGTLQGGHPPTGGPPTGAPLNVTR